MRIASTPGFISPSVVSRIKFHRRTLGQGPWQDASSQMLRNQPAPAANQRRPRLLGTRQQSRIAKTLLPHGAGPGERKVASLGYLQHADVDLRRATGAGSSPVVTTIAASLLRRSRPFPSQRRRADAAIHAVPDPAPAAWSPERRFALPDAAVRGPDFSTTSVARSTTPQERTGLLLSFQ